MAIITMSMSATWPDSCLTDAGPVRFAACLSTSAFLGDDGLAQSLPLIGDIPVDAKLDSDCGFEPLA